MGNCACMARGPQIQQQRLGTSEQPNSTKLRSPPPPSARASCPAQRPWKPGHVPSEPPASSARRAFPRTRFPSPLAQDLCESARPLCQLALKRPTLPSRFLGLRLSPCFFTHCSNGPSIPCPSLQPKSPQPSDLTSGFCPTFASVWSLRLPLCPVSFTYPLPSSPALALPWSIDRTGHFTVTFASQPPGHSAYAAYRLASSTSH